MTNTEMAIKRIEEQVDILNILTRHASEEVGVARRDTMAKRNRTLQWVFGALEMIRMLDGDHWYTLASNDESGEYELRVTE